MGTCTAMKPRPAARWQALQGSGQLGIGLGEAHAILGVDSASHRFDRTGGVLGGQANRSALAGAAQIRRKEIKLIGRELPVAELACKPQLDVAELHFGHLLGQARFIRPDDRSCRLLRLSRCRREQRQEWK